MTRMVAMVLDKILAEAGKRGEDPYSSASFVAARAAQADPQVTAAFSCITSFLAEAGVALEGDGLGWRRRGLYGKGRRLVATKRFRPGEVIFKDAACTTMRYDTDLPEHKSNGPNLILHSFAESLFLKPGEDVFTRTVAFWGCLFPAFAFRWRDQQDVAHLDAIRYPTMPVPDFPFRDAAYFFAQGKQLLHYFKHCERSEQVVPLRVVWVRIAHVQRVWGIPSRAPENDDETRILVLARVCDVLYWNKLTLYSTTGMPDVYALYSHVARVGLNHSCWPNSALRFEKSNGDTLEKGLTYGSQLVVYAIADIAVGEEVAVSYLVDTYIGLLDMQASLQVTHGFQCRNCPRCNDYWAIPTRARDLHREYCDVSEEVQRQFTREFNSFDNMLAEEGMQLLTGGTYGGSRPRSVTECFSKLIPAVLAWLSRAEAILPPLSRDLRNARRMLGFCHFARQECDQAMPYYEKAVETERECFPLYSHLRIGTLKHLIKSMALQGQGATARFDELVEEVATLKTINYGAGNEDSVGDESIKADLFISEIQEALARDSGGREVEGGRG